MHTSRMIALAIGLTVGLAAPALAQDKVVRVWHTETEPQTIKAFNDIARRFEARNPGVKIAAEGLAWTDLEGKIMASLAAGSPPELSHGQPITCTALQSKGLLNPLDEVVKAIGELIKSNGGALFDKNNKPLLTDKKMIEVLEFWRELVKYAPPGWEGHGYLQTFQNLYGQKAAMMFQGYGRGAGLIEKFAPKEMANDKTFDVWSKPVGPSGKEPGVQVDEEPWMLFKDAKHQKEAIEFLKFFYQDDNYLEYVSTVPIHLFPITKSLRASPKYQNLEMIQRWKGWIEVQQGYLDKDQGKPTLVVDWSDMTEKPYLLEVLGSGIIRDMVMDVVLEKWEPQRAAEKAQKRLEDLLRSKGYLKG